MCCPPEMPKYQKDGQTSGRSFHTSADEEQSESRNVWGFLLVLLETKVMLEGLELQKCVRMGSEQL